MKSVLAALLAFALATPAFAEESACVRGFRLANADFYTKTDNLKMVQGASEVTKWVVGPTAGAACAILARRSWWGLAGCAFLGVAVSAGGYVSSNVAASSIEREKAIAQAGESFLIYQVYRSHRLAEAGTSADVMILLRALGVNVEDDVDDSQIAIDAAAAVANLMEDGTLCNGGDKPAVNYWSMLPLVKQSLSIGTNQ